MLSADDLRKQLTAAEAYNRFMEKRVRMLELEVKMLQSASNFATLAREHNEGQEGRSPPSGGGRDGKSPQHKDARDMTAGQILEELTRLRTDHKANVSELKRVKKDLAMATANLQHMTAKEQQQRQRVAQLSEEVRQLRSLLPPHLFDVADNWAARTRGGAGTAFEGIEDDRQSTNTTAGSSAPDGRSVPAVRANVQSSEAANAVRKLSADVAAFSESLLLLPNQNFSSATTTTSAAPSQLPYDLTQVLAANERSSRFREISQRVHTVLRFSKKELVDPAETAGLTQSNPSAVVLLKVDRSTKKVDRTMQQLEGLLSLVERSCDRLKESVLDLPKSVAQYLSKCRSGISLVVDGQRANTPSAVAALQAQAQLLATELSRHREEFRVGLHNVRHHMAALCSVMMSAADAALGINMYRNLAHAPKLVAALESHVVLLFGLDHALELEALREYASGKSATSAAEAPWYADGIELEREVRRLSLLDPKTDRIEKMDILAIKRLFPDALSMAAASASASGGGMNPAFAEAVVMLETIKTTATQLCRLFRGELVAGGPASSLVSSPFDGELVTNKGVQCNLQLQKMELTDNELHIARLAGIRSNWFDAAIESQGTGSSSTQAIPGGDASLTASNATAGNVTPRSGGPRTPRGGAAGGVHSSAGGPNVAANVAMLVKEFLARFPSLDIPANFAPYRPKVQLARFTSDEGTFYHFGRRVISLRMGSNGQSLIVQFGGGYLSLEEFCLKYGPTEARMTERRLSPPSSDRAGSPPVVPPTSDGSPSGNGMHPVARRPSSIPKLRNTPSLSGSAAV